MNIAGALSSIGTQGVTDPSQKNHPAGAAVATPFGNVFESILDQSRDLGKQASTAITGLLSGQGVEVHDVVIASQKASAAFELALQVRNKAVSAYQQMMGMQF